MSTASVKYIKYSVLKEQMTFDLGRYVMIIRYQNLC